MKRKWKNNSDFYLLFILSMKLKKSKNLIPHTRIVHHPEGLIEYRLRTETFRQFLQVFV
nr:MAG TPA: hypothetical protein [Caudoviricetes sp.]